MWSTSLLCGTGVIHWSTIQHCQEHTERERAVMCMKSPILLHLPGEIVPWVQTLWHSILFCDHRFLRMFVEVVLEGCNIPNATFPCPNPSRYATAFGGPGLQPFTSSLWRKLPQRCVSDDQGIHQWRRVVPGSHGYLAWCSGKWINDCSAPDSFKPSTRSWCLTVLVPVINLCYLMFMKNRNRHNNCPTILLIVSTY